MTTRYSSLTGRIVDDRPTLRLHLAQMPEVLASFYVERFDVACDDKNRRPPFDYAAIERRFLDLLDRSQMRRRR